MAAGTLVSSGSSLNMPTGSGSERLRRLTLHDNSDSTVTVLTGVAGHIYTILSISAADTSNSASTLGILINDGTNNIYLLNATTSLPASGSFVWNDRFVVEEDDTLKLLNGVGGCDWIVSYIDQDWT